MPDPDDFVGKTLLDLASRISELVRPRSSAEDADMRFRGFFLSEDDPVKICASFFQFGFGGFDVAQGVSTRLVELRGIFDLDPLEVDAVVYSLAPEIDYRFAKLYSHLNQDENSDHLTIGLFLTLVGANTFSGQQHLLFGQDSALVVNELLELDLPSARSQLATRLKVPPSVAAFCLGQSVPDPYVSDLISAVDPFPAELGETVGPPGGATGDVYVRDPSMMTQDPPAQAVAAIAREGLVPVQLNLASPKMPLSPARLARLLAREARLKGLGLLVGPAENLESVIPGLLAEIVHTGVAAVFYGTGAWDPNWSHSSPRVVEIAELAGAESSKLWADELSSALPKQELQELVRVVRLPAGSIRRVAQRAEMEASLAGRAVESSDLHIAVRFEHSAGLESAARRIEPEVGWDDLVVVAPVLTQLKELANRVRNREVVYSEWGFRPGGGRGAGVTALFAGDSGTGKTMAAEVVANDLSVDLYTINLATVVDKYIGETEKNLERLFSQARGVNGILFFDEADAIFGKRSEVKDARDRYANTEVAYLLQKMESFAGVVILATNLRSNLDEAFTRRLDMVVDFPKPTPAERETLWHRALDGRAALADGIDWTYLAESFEISGGNITNSAITAAHLAATDSRPIEMFDLVRGVYYEYRKLGRLVLAAEFGQWLEQINQLVDSPVAGAGPSGLHHAAKRKKK